MSPFQVKHHVVSSGNYLIACWVTKAESLSEVCMLFRGNDKDADMQAGCKGNTGAGSPSGAFGQPSGGLFGQPQGSAPFGQASTPAFGAASTPAFGAASTPSLFSSSSSPAQGGFGFGSTPAFGAASTPAFGASSTPAFGQVRSTVVPVPTAALRGP